MTCLMNSDLTKEVAAAQVATEMKLSLKHLYQLCVCVCVRGMLNFLVSFLIAVVLIASK